MGKEKPEEFIWEILRESGKSLIELTPTISSDAERLHQFRVALRKLRTYLSAFKDPLGREWVEIQLGYLKSLDDACTNVRTTDVLSRRLHTACSELNISLEIANQFLEENSHYRNELEDVLKSKPFRNEKSEIETWTDSRSLDIKVKKLKPFLRATHKKSWKRFKKAATSDKVDLHAVRILSKKARYVAEICSKFLGEKVKRRANYLAEIQDLLGEYHDSVELLRWLESQPSSKEIGFLIQRERSAQLKLLDDFSAMVPN